MLCLSVLYTVVLHACCCAPMVQVAQFIWFVMLGWGGEVDMWAVGILLYWMLSGHTPFEAPTISGIFVNIELGRYRSSPSQCVLCPGTTRAEPDAFIHYA